MPEHKIFEISRDSDFFKEVLDFGRGILRLKNEFAEKAKGSGLPIQQDSALQDALSDYKREKTQELGMDYAVICIEDRNPQAYPRAYEHKPVIYGSSFQVMENGTPKNQSKFFLYSPIGHNGDFFHPEGVRLVTDKNEEERINGLLFAGGWSDPSFRFFDRFPVGVPIPEDYERPDVHNHQPYAHAKLTFLLGGQSQDFVNNYKQRLEDFQQKTSDAMACLKGIVVNDLRSDILGRIEPGEDYYLGMSMSGKELSFSIRLEGRNDIMMAGQPIPLSDNMHFSVQATEQRYEYKVIPKSDTKQGRELERSIDVIPPRPSLGDYNALIGDFTFEQNDVDRLLGADGRTPMLRDLQGYDVLVYNTDDTSASDFCPEGCIRLPPSIYFWLEQDRQDAQMGVSAPPAPEVLIQELSDFSNVKKLDYTLDDHGTFEL